MKHDVDAGPPAGPAVRSSESGWIGTLTDVSQALNYLDCLLRANSWVHRRVDTVDFVGRSLFRQRTSLDLTIPARCPLYNIAGDEVQILPLIPIMKVPLINFDIRDNEDREFNVLTRSQNNTIVVRGMLSLADNILRTRQGRSPSLLYDYGVPGCSCNYSINCELPPEARLPVWKGPCSEEIHETTKVQAEIVRLISGTRDQGHEVLRSFGSAPSGSIRKRLWKKTLFKVLAQRFAVTYYLAVCITRNENTFRRRVIKLSYDRFNNGLESSRNDNLSRSSRLVNFLTAIAWLPTPVRTDANAAVDCESYHLEIVAPPGLKICGLKWRIGPPWRDLKDRPFTKNGIERSRARVTNELGNDAITTSSNFCDDGEPTRLHTSISHVPMGYQVECQWQFAPNAFSWLFLAVPSALVAAGLLFLFSANPVQGVTAEPIGTCPDGLVSQRQGGAMKCVTTLDPSALAVNRLTLLLGVLALMGAVLLRSGENDVTKRQLMSTRFAIVVSVFLLLIAGVGLVIGQHDLQTSTYDWISPALQASRWVALAVFVMISLAQLTAWGRLRRSLRARRRSRRPQTMSSFDEYWELKF